jgi:ubiquinone/menaquinone biosynthesis C-methylase UbiE
MARENAVYTHGHHTSVLRSHRWRTAENSAAYLLERLRPGVSLLDVGCGPGTITADLAARVAPGSVTAIEVAPEVLEDAERLIAERGLDNVDFAVADVHALPYPDDAFDVVHAHQVLQHVTDPVRALREMRRVCRPGGIVAARDADYAAMTWYPDMPAMDEWRSVYRRVARANGGEPDAGRRLLSWARQAGFRDITATASVWCFATPEDRAWWSETWGERVVRSAFAERAVSGGHAAPEDLRRISDAWHAWGSAEDGWFGVLHGEIVCRA